MKNQKWVVIINDNYESYKIIVEELSGKDIYDMECDTGQDTIGAAVYILAEKYDLTDNISVYPLNEFKKLGCKVGLSDYTIKAI